MLQIGSVWERTYSMTKYITSVIVNTGTSMGNFCPRQKKLLQNIAVKV
jgi:hypothetical protein